MINGGYKEAIFSGRSKADLAFFDRSLYLHTGPGLSGKFSAKIRDGRHLRILSGGIVVKQDQSAD